MKTPALVTHFDRDADERKAAPDLAMSALMRRLFTYTKPYGKRLRWLYFLTVSRAFLTTMLTWAVAAVVNGPINSGSVQGIAWGAAGYAGLMIFTQWLFHFRIRYALELGEAVVHDIRNELFTHLQRMTMGFYDRTKLGRIVGRMTSDIDAIRIGVQEVVFVGLVQCGTMITGIALMIWCDLVMFGVVMAIAPILFLLHRQFKTKAGAAQRKMQESFSRVTATLAESVNGIRVTQGFAREEVNAGAFRELVLDHSQFNSQAARTQALFLPALDFVSQIFMALLIFIGGWRVLHGQMELAAVVQFFFLANLVFDPIRSLGNLYNNSLSAMVGAERVFRLLDAKADWKDDAKAVVLPRSAHGAGCRVVFDRVHFSYDTKKPVLDDVSFVAEPGQTVALVGHTGSGKSTVTGLVSKLYLPTGGKITVDGLDITALQSDSLRQQMGIVLQQSFLFEGDVLENIRFSRPEATIQEVVEAVGDLGFLDLIEALPGGFHAPIGEGGAGLSQGQKQLISFARALLADPRILILDEATSSIDALTEARLQKALGTLLKGRTSFVVAHRLSTIRSADVILVLDHGKIVERGTHDELLAFEGIYRGLHDQFVQAAEA